MKVKVYIITYNAPDVLEHNLDSLYYGLGNPDPHEVIVNVINNHSNFYLDDVYKNDVKVLHNVVRPDFSCGHLSRDYNTAILNGFKSIISPDCDIQINAPLPILLFKIILALLRVI